MAQAVFWWDVKILSQLKTWADFIFANDESFLGKFGNEDAWILSEVHFSHKEVKFVYIDWEGPHIADYISIDEFLEWYDKTACNA